MIPIRDNNPTKTRPYLCYLIIAINIVVYLIDKVGAYSQLGNLWNFSMVPKAVVTNHPVYVTIGTNQLGQMVEALHSGINPQYMTIFSSMFMHASLTHIGGNMLYLWIFGNNIEESLGHFKFIVFYLASGVLAAFAHIYFNLGSTTPTVGASGAIAGVLGAYLVLYPRATVDALVLFGFFWTTVELSAIWLLGVWFVTQLIGLGGSGGMQGGGVAYWAHIGGFAAGIALIFLLGAKRKAYRNSGYIEKYEDY